MSESERVARLEKALSLLASRMKDQDQRIESLERHLASETSSRRQLQSALQTVATRFEELVRIQQNRMDDALQEVVDIVANAVSTVEDPNTGSNSPQP
eukprot:ANDGO_05470.mRNA.1 hypothetical protein